MRLEDLDYVLPERLIAQSPLPDRSQSRLMVLPRDGSPLEHRQFSECVDLLHRGDLLVMNDTRVTARRLVGERPTGGKVEILILRQVDVGLYKCLCKPAKRLRTGDQIHFDELVATINEDLGQGRKRISFFHPQSVEEGLLKHGTIPLPPYIHCALDDEDRYQTVYASHPGSAAAPTAGLHFTPTILRQLQSKGVEIATVTLDVGMDTFRPITADDPLDHPIHGEACRVPTETAEAIRRCKGRIVAVGTTTVRTLESMAMGRRAIKSGLITTDLYIFPGYNFQIVDGMFTNFHLPRTTMLMMISALAGHGRVMEAYHQAVQAEYRFLSFGDSMLIL